MSSETLQAKLEIAAIRDRDLDREIAADWLVVDHELCRQLDAAEMPEPSIRGPHKRD